MGDKAESVPTPVRTVAGYAPRMQRKRESRKLISRLCHVEVQPPAVVGVIAAQASVAIYQETPTRKPGPQQEFARGLAFLLPIPIARREIASDMCQDPATPSELLVEMGESRTPRPEPFAGDHYERVRWFVVDRPDGHRHSAGRSSHVPLDRA